MDEERRARVEKLRVELESAQQGLREAMDFLNDDRHLTAKGIRLREDLRREMRAIEKDTEAVRQEHRLD
jgi:hypothetical protein